jgi:hypothetical protein
MPRLTKKTAMQQIDFIGLLHVGYCRDFAVLKDNDNEFFTDKHIEEEYVVKNQCAQHIFKNWELFKMTNIIDILHQPKFN